MRCNLLWKGLRYHVADYTKYRSDDTPLACLIEQFLTKIKIFVTVKL